MPDLNSKYRMYRKRNLCIRIYLGQLYRWKGKAEGVVLGVLLLPFFPANTYLFKVNNRNTRKMCQMRSKLRRKTPRLLLEVN